MEKDEKAHERVTAVLRELIQKMGLEFDDIAVSETAGQTLFTIHTKDSGVLIGSGGETLHALNHLVKKSFEGPEGEKEPFRFIIDVNGYHLKHIQALEGEAKMLAERARTFRHDVEMSPMNPYDRLIVHAALTGLPDIATESAGEGPVRHIVIKYIASV